MPWRTYNRSASKERLRSAEADLSRDIAVRLAYECRSWDVWNQPFETHLKRILRDAAEDGSALIWC